MVGWLVGWLVVVVVVVRKNIREHLLRMSSFLFQDCGRFVVAQVLSFFRGGPRTVLEEAQRKPKFTALYKKTQPNTLYENFFEAW